MLSTLLLALNLAGAMDPLAFVMVVVAGLGGAYLIFRLARLAMQTCVTGASSRRYLTRLVVKLAWNQTRLTCRQAQKPKALGRLDLSP